MLQELFFALLGKSNDIFIEIDSKLQVNPDSNIFSIPEQELINNILILGS